MKNHPHNHRAYRSQWLWLALLLILPLLGLSFILSDKTVRSDAISGDPDDQWSVFGMHCQDLPDFPEVLLEKEGTLYVGNGTQGKVGTWDGKEWSTIGGGVSGQLGTRVKAMVFDGDNLYVGGFFSKAGEVTVSNIAKWDGTHWTSLGPGLDDEVFDLAFHNGILYACGRFMKAGTLTVNRIASWNGTEWRAYESGVNALVNTISVTGDSIFIGGNFTNAGALSVERIACWNGMEWQALGSGMNQFVTDIEIHKGEVYAAGAFWLAGGISANRVAKWNGSNWESLGSGVSDAVHDILVHDEDIYIAGSFKSIVGVGPANMVAKWDSLAWTPFGHTISGNVYDIIFSGQEFVVAGILNLEGMDLRILRLMDDQWQFFCENDDRGMKGKVDALILHNGQVYAGGEFKMASHQLALGLARFDGNYWQSIGGDGPVESLASKDNVLFASGYFFNLWNGIEMHGIVQWDGIKWDSLGNGLGDYKRVMVADEQYLYVGGSFNLPGGLNGIARWDGENWSALGDGTNGDVYSMFIDEGILYIGGLFSSVSGVQARNIAKWDGVSWSAMGNGSIWWVFSIDKFDHKIHIGTFGGDVGTGPNFLRWDGDSWQTLGAGLNGTIRALEPLGDGLYAGGEFTTSHDGQSLAHIAKWNGTNWENLGSGTDGNVEALLAIGSDLVVGGDFDHAGTKNSSNIAVWGSQLVSTDVLDEFYHIIIYPNPVSGILHVDVKDAAFKSEAKIMMYNVNGQLMDMRLVPDQNPVKIETSHLPPGIYFLTLTDGQRMITKKVVVN